MKAFGQQVLKAAREAPREKSPKITGDANPSSETIQEIHKPRHDLRSVARKFKARVFRELQNRYLNIDYQYPAVIANPLLVQLLGDLEKRPGVYRNFADFYEDVTVRKDVGAIHWILGDFSSSKRALKTVFPHLALEGRILIGLHETLQADVSKAFDQQSIHLGQYIDDDKTPILAAYLEVLAETNIDLELAEAIAKAIPWILPPKQEWRERFLGITIDILIQRSKFVEAANHLAIWQAAFLRTWQSERYTEFTLLSAMAADEGVALAELHPNFVIALVVSCISFTPWGLETLDVLYYFGKALIGLKLLKAAAVVLEECVMGCVHQYGAHHPYSLRAFAAIRACHMSAAQKTRLRRYSHPTFDREMQLSIAYEHIHLKTPIDLLQEAGEIKIDYQSILNLLVPSDLKSSRVRTNLLRTRGRCNFELGNAHKARYLSDDEIVLKDTDFSDALSGVSIELDMVKFSEDPLRSSKAFLQRCQAYLSLPEHQNEAVHRRLTAAGLTHFTFDILQEDPPLISEKDSERLRIGTYAVVDSVKIGTKAYARKSISLPRFHQKRVRETIQNEISVMRSLDHPHIVSLFLTYEETSRFCIVMQPLAVYDLEAFLEKHTAQFVSDEHCEIILKKDK